MTSKGIIRLLEAIIASVIILTAMSFFFTAKFRPQVEENFIYQQAYDAISVLDSLPPGVPHGSQQSMLVGYVKDNDAEHLTSTLSSLFPSTIGFSVEVKNIVNPKIYVACNCSENEINELRNALEPRTFFYNNRRIETFIDNTTIDNIKEGANILMFVKYVDLNNHKTKINDFLDSGGTVFLLSSLTQQQVEDGFMNNTFGLKWSSLPSSLPGRFAVTDDVTNATKKIYKYYISFNESFADVENGIFTDFRTNSLIYGGANTVIVDSSGNNAFVKFRDKLGKNNKGRFIWFSDYTRLSGTNSTKNMDNLFKATIMWASGERFSMDYPEPKTLPNKRVQIYYIVSGSDNFEPFVVVLSVWRIFF